MNGTEGNEIEKYSNFTMTISQIKCQNSAKRNCVEVISLNLFCRHEIHQIVEHNVIQK